MKKKKKKTAVWVASEERKKESHERRGLGGEGDNMRAARTPMYVHVRGGRAQGVVREG